jgi:RNA polymerase sigma-70 factor (ECF subfamily)
MAAAPDVLIKIHAGLGPEPVLADAAMLLTDGAVANDPATSRMAPWCAESRRDFVGQLYSSHSAALRRFLSRFASSEQEAEDLAQEVFIRVLRLEDLERIRDRARSYMFQTAINLVRDTHRRGLARHRTHHVPLDDVALESPGFTPDEEAEAMQRLEAIEMALSTVRDDARRAFYLHAVDGLNYTEIASKMGVTTRTIERWMSAAQASCRTQLFALT